MSADTFSDLKDTDYVAFQVPDDLTSPAIELDDHDLRYAIGRLPGLIAASKVQLNDEYKNLPAEFIRFCTTRRLDTQNIDSLQIAVTRFKAESIAEADQAKINEFSRLVDKTISLQKRLAELEAVQKSRQQKQERTAPAVLNAKKDGGKEEEKKGSFATLSNSELMSKFEAITKEQKGLQAELGRIESSLPEQELETAIEAFRQQRDTTKIQEYEQKLTKLGIQIHAGTEPNAAQNSANRKRCDVIRSRLIELASPLYDLVAEIKKRREEEKKEIKSIAVVVATGSEAVRNARKT